MTTSSVLRACPQCGGSMPGRRDELVWICSRCQIGRGGDGSTLPVEFLAARGFDKGIALPFYRFTAVEWGAKVMATEAEAAVARLGPPPVVWVVALRIRQFQGHGDVSFEYTRRPPRLETAPPRPVVPVTRSRADAEIVAELVLRRLVAEQHPPGSFELSPRLGQAVLSCVPSNDDNGLVKLPHCPIRYPREQIEGYRAVLRQK